MIVGENDKMLKKRKRSRLRLFLRLIERAVCNDVPTLRRSGTASCDWECGLLAPEGSSDGDTQNGASGSSDPVNHRAGPALTQRLSVLNMS